MRRYRRAAPSIEQRECAGLRGLPCVHGPAVRHARCEIVGPIAPVSIEQARHDVVQFVRGGAGERERLAQYIAQTGHCILHAQHELSGSAVCHCAPCSDPADPRRPWSLDSSRIARENAVIGGAS